MMRRIGSMAGRSVRHPNLHAVGVAAIAAAAVYLNTDPLPAGSEPLAVMETELAFATTSMTPQFVTAPVPVVQAQPLSDGMEPTTPSESATSVTPTSAASVIAGSNILAGKFAMQVNVLVLQEGIAKFSKIPDYTATFTKQERIGGDLGNVEQISLKVRQEPLSIYMKWHSGQTGQQVIYVEGQNEGKMLVKPGGVKGRLTGTLTIDPNGDLAMAQARYPVMVVGLKSVAERIIQYQQDQIDKGDNYTCEFRDDVMYDERPCYRCLVVYKSREASPDYRKSEMLIDKQLQMPVVLKNYTWAEDADPAMLDEQTLVEQYAYSEIKVQQQLADGDFDRTNESYRMKK